MAGVRVSFPALLEGPLSATGDQIGLRLFRNFPFVSNNVMCKTCDMCMLDARCQSRLAPLLVAFMLLVALLLKEVP
jgi:hypothetical protein